MQNRDPASNGLIRVLKAVTDCVGNMVGVSVGGIFGEE